MIAVAFVLIVFLVLWGVSENWCKDTNQAFVDSAGFRSWMLMAAMSATLWGAEFLAGFCRLRALSLVRRDLDLRRQVGLYFLLAVLAWAVAFFAQEGWERPAVPLGWWHWGSYLFIVLGVVAAAPWVILLWLTNRDLVALGLHSPPAKVEPLWQQLEASLVAIGGILATATLTTAAMRLAATAAVPGVDGGATFIPKTSWPSSDILLFGALFTTLSAFAVVPVLINWRAAASTSLKTLDNPSYTPANREEWTRRLHLGQGIMKSPLALLSIFSPLATATLSLFLPELSSR